MFRLDSNEKNMQTTHEFLLNFIFSNKIWISWIKIHNGYSRKKNSKNKRKIYQTSEKHIYRLAWNCDKKYFASENKVVRNLAVQILYRNSNPKRSFFKRSYSPTRALAYTYDTLVYFIIFKFNRFSHIFSHSFRLIHIWIFHMKSVWFSPRLLTSW